MPDTTRPVRRPARRVRILVEDPLLTEDLAPRLAGVEVTACPGPAGTEVCPLVTDGACPLGPCDVVVSALDGAWACSVRAAWSAAGTPLVDTSGLAVTDPAARLDHHVGAAIQRLWPAPTDDG